MDKTKLVYLFQGYLTVTDKAQRLSEEYGDVDNIAGVEIINPIYVIGSDSTENEVDVLTGNANGQNKLVSPGGTDERGVSKLSDIYAKARKSGESVRIIFDVYGERE